LISVIAGTWGLNQLVTSAPLADGSVAAVIAGPRPGEFVVTDAGPTSASAFEWFVDSVLGSADKGQTSRDGLFDFCNKEVLRARADSDLPYFLPYLNGRLEQPEARASFIGLASWHGLAQMVRAIYEGVAFEHRGHIDHLLMGRERPRAARFAGGAARSRPWLDIFDAAVAAMTKVRARIEPDPALVRVLAQRNAVYAALSDALKPLWERLSPGG